MKAGRTMMMTSTLIALCLVGGLPMASDAQIVQQIIDASGDGLGATLEGPEGIALDGNGNVYVAGGSSGNVFKIDSNGVVSLLADFGGASLGEIGVDAAGNVFVQELGEDRVFKITPGGAVSTVLTAAGDGVSPYDRGEGLAVGANGVVYASGSGCSNPIPGPCPDADRFANVFRISPTALPELVLDKTGGGLLAIPTLSPYRSLAVDSAGNLYVASNTTSTVFKITPTNQVSIAIDFDTEPRFDSPVTVATDSGDHLYVITEADRIFQVTPGGSIFELLYQDPPSFQWSATGLAPGPGGTIYLAANATNQVVQVLLSGSHSVIMDSTGDGVNPFQWPSVGSIAVDSAGTVYVTGSYTDNAFRIVPPGPFELSRKEQSCVNALNKGLRKVSAAQGKAYLGCVRDASRGDLGVQTIEECVAADGRMKVQRAQDKVVADDTKRCASVSPSFGATDAGVINTAALNVGTEILRDLFGPDLDSAVVPDASPTDATAKCQGSVAKSFARCEDVHLKEFTKCKKRGLKDASITARVGIAACIAADPKGKIAKACAPADGKIRSDLDSRCGGINLPSTFPGRCIAATDSAAAAQCLDEAARCRACRAANIADALSVDCDSVDDGLDNQSCVPVCGDNFVEGAEECDDGNMASEDGCSEACSIESCGDGVVQAGLGENCDDGNNDDFDGCNAVCIDEFCGDGIANDLPNEECDGADDALCPGNCQPGCACSVPLTLGSRLCSPAPGSNMDTVDSNAQPIGGAVTDGLLDIDCGQVDPVTGRADCTCELLEPMLAFPDQLLAVCLSPTGQSCAAGSIDCDGGDAIDVALVSEHDIGTCTGGTDCTAQCDAHCAGLGGESVTESQCEGYCTGGANDDLACSAPSDCPGGTCFGWTPIDNTIMHPGACGCHCREVGGTPTGNGGLSCQVAAEVSVEFGPPCGDGDAFLSLGTQCLQLTSGETEVTLLETAVGTIGPISVPGTPRECLDIGIAGLRDLALTGAVNTFHGNIDRDVSSIYTLVCE